MSNITNVEHVAKTLGQGKEQKSGDGFMTLCPCHNDRTPSLSVAEKNGRLLAHCFAGCSQQDVIQTLKDLDLWPKVHHPTEPTKYTYYNDDVKLLFHKYRDPISKKEWVWPKGVKERALYYQKEVREAVKLGIPIHIVEGEKDVETLRLHDMCATTNAFGAKENWEKYVPVFEGAKQVIIFPDNDEAGKQAALYRANLLRKSVASLKIAEVPTGKDITEYIEAGSTKEELQGLIAEASEFDFPESKGDHHRLCLLTIANFGFNNLIYSQGNFWNWNGSGVWQKCNDRQIKKTIHSVTPKEIKRSVTDSVLDLIKTETFESDQVFNSGEPCINCLNGELYFQDGAWTLQPHNKKHYSTTQIPVAYDPTAKAPFFENALFQWFEGDADCNAKVNLILELMGYTLFPSCEYEKFVMLIGRGANGKSVFLSILESLCGKENVAGVTPAQFDNKFQRAHLQGKLANIVTEIAEGAQLQDAELKSFTSGELMTVEHKYGHPYTYRPHATCWFGTNHLPHTKDFSDALLRRAIILEFNQKFEGKRCDPHLKKKLLLELPGILNLALAHFGRVKTTDLFTECYSNERSKGEWRFETDHLSQFVEDECVESSNLKISSKELYARYEEWADDSHIKGLLNKKNFTNRLKLRGIETKKSTGGKRMLLGIALK